MDFITRLFGGAGKKSATGYPDFGGTWIGGGGPDFVSNLGLLENNREWVFIAVDKVAAAVASVRFKVMRFERNGDDRELFDGPLVRFLEAPGENLTGKDFIYLNTAYKELTGNALWEKISPTSVQPLIPTRVVPVLDDSQRRILGFRYTEKAGQRTILADDVLHDRYIDPSNPLWGRGKLEKIARWADVSSYATEFLRRFFSQGATFGGFIETEEESETRIKLIKAGLVNDHVGVANSHKMAVLPKGAKYSKTTANMAEIEMGATDDRYRDKILSGFGVPKTLVGLTTEVNRASAEAAEYVFAKYTVKPIVEDFVEFLNVNVVPLIDPKGTAYIAYDDFIPANQEIALKERELALAKQPYMTVNEVRATVGLPPVEGGDAVYGTPSMQPLGTPPPVPVIPPAPADEEPADPSEEDEEDDEAEPTRALPRHVRKAFKQDTLIDRLAKRAIAAINASVDLDAESHKDFVGRVSTYEEELADTVRAFNDRQEREVADRLRKLTKSVKKGDVLDIEREVGVLIDFVSPLLGELMLAQAQADYLALEFPGQFDPKAPAIKRVVAATAKRLAKSYNDTSAKLIADAINAGISEGEDFDQIADRVKSVYEFSNDFRAEQVAKTEAFHIANEGSREAYKQSGVVQSMRWYTAEDERECEFCQPMNGVEVGIEETFFDKGATITGVNGGTMSADYRAIDVPPLHPNCRCFIRPERIDIG